MKCLELCIFCLTFAMCLAEPVLHRQRRLTLPTRGQVAIGWDGGVAADNKQCSDIGANILRRGGNAVDAAIAALICIGVVNPHASGLGGGHFMTVYKKNKKKCKIFDARETAPAFANPNMYKENPKEAQVGWRAIAVPGEIHGLFTAFREERSRKIQWWQLFEETIRLLETDLKVSGSLAEAIQADQKDLSTSPEMLEIFKPNGEWLIKGQRIRRPAFLQFLKNLAAAGDPIEWFYNSEEVTQKLVNEFQEGVGNGPTITREDFRNYRTVSGDQRPPIEMDINDRFVACGPPPPSSSAVTLSILNVMKNFKMLPNAGVGEEDFHRFIESQKFAYAARSLIGDMDYVEDALQLAKNLTEPWYGLAVKNRIEDKAQDNLTYYWYNKTVPGYKPKTAGNGPVRDRGTTHISVLDKDGNAVSVTSTINYYFGARRVSKSTGLIWNDEMDDFSNEFTTKNNYGYAPSPANYIKPGKRPVSSMSPIVVYDKHIGKVKLVAGGAGGARIISSTAQ